ncbi:hypothetical protein RF55_7761 [Lasius niger]|uniref:Regulatory protein zeste n=1 Tax=Lasius niger TaxID=67767 RepID=A0A0J7KPS8_LASNI|nr:hypothetical protein RF55_7761 [Lasius niger]
MMSEKKERIRQGRATMQQIEALITFIEKHPEVASGKFTTINGHDNLEKQWQELATYLNSLVPHGKGKDVKSWKTTWRDHKSKVSEKIQKIRKGRAATGNNPVQVTLTDLDKRILGIIGHDYVQGLSNVPDSFPEEHNNAIEELSAGNTIILNDAPAPIIIAELPQETNIDLTENYADIQYDIENFNAINENEIQDENVIQDASSSSCIPSTSQENTGRKRKRTRSVSTERLGVQLADAREAFEEIADKHAEAMKTLSEAMKLQAEATCQLSNAVDRMARNEERQTKLIELIFKLLSKDT